MIQEGHGRDYKVLLRNIPRQRFRCFRECHHDEPAGQQRLISLPYQALDCGFVVS